MSARPAPSGHQEAGMKGFKQFVMRGNVVDLAVGLIIGAAFGAIVTSFVNDVIMPPVGMILGGVDFANLFVLLKEGAKAPAELYTELDLVLKTARDLFTDEIETIVIDDKEHPRGHKRFHMPEALSGLRG